MKLNDEAFCAYFIEKAGGNFYHQFLSLICMEAIRGGGGGGSMLSSKLNLFATLKNNSNH